MFGISGPVGEHVVSASLRVQEKTPRLNKVVYAIHSEAAKASLPKRESLLSMLKSVVDYLHFKTVHVAYRVAGLLGIKKAEKHPDKQKELNRNFLDAVFRKDLHGAQRFLRQGADINAITPNQNHALDIAIINKDEQMVELLLRHGANPAMFAGRTISILQSLIHGTPKISQMLLNKKEDRPILDYVYQLKMLVHRFGLKGELKNFVGNWTGVSMREVALSAEQFLGSGPIVDALQNAFLRDERDVKRVVAEINQGRIGAMSTYFATENGYHGVGIVVCGDHLIKCNRGMRQDGDICGLEIYRIGNPGNLEQALNRFVELQTAHQLGTEYYERGINELLDLTFEEEISHKEQTIGNCTFASSKLLLEAAVYLEQRQKGLDHEEAETIAREKYKAFTAFDREQSVEEFLELIINQPGITQEKLMQVGLPAPGRLLQVIAAKLHYPRQNALYERMLEAMRKRPDLFDPADEEKLKYAKQFGTHLKSLKDHEAFIVLKTLTDDTAESEKIKNYLVPFIIEKYPVDKNPLTYYFLEERGLIDAENAKESGRKKCINLIISSMARKKWDFVDTFALNDEMLQEAAIKQVRKLPEAARDSFKEEFHVHYPHIMLE